MIKYVLLIVVIAFFPFQKSQAQAGHSDSSIIDLLNRVSRENIVNYVDSLSFANGNESRITFTDGNRWSAHYIKRTFESFPGLTSVAFDTFLISTAPPPYHSQFVFNVVATLRGREEPEKIYLVTGHYDCSASRDNTINYSSDWNTAKARGADDNATGIATMFEIARILSDSTNNWQSKYSIQFVAFAAEESHPIYSGSHLGSFTLAKRAFSKSSNILGVFNVDMVGFNNTGNNHVEIVSDNHSQFLGETFNDMKTSYMIDLHSNSEPFPSATYSDHESFWRYDYPAILLIENAPPWNDNQPWYWANPYYHTRLDQSSTINFAQVENITKTLVAALGELCKATTQSAVDFTTNQPDDFYLLQNYPNPFNLATTIRYDLEKASHVRVKIYSIAGKLVAVLVDQPQEAGKHAITWGSGQANQSDIASGIYLLVLEIGRERLIRKMILTK